MITNHDSRDAGLGLIELIVAMVVSGIVIIAVATIFGRSWLTQERVISVSEATTRGQVVSAAIERALRNALYVQVSDSGTVLRVSTSLSGSLKCQGFRLTSASGGSAQFMTSGSALTDPATWPELDDGVVALGSNPFFDASTPGVVSFSFQIATESAPVRFSGEVAPRSIQEGDSDSCWV